MLPRSITTNLGEINSLTFNCRRVLGIFSSVRKWLLKTNTLNSHWNYKVTCKCLYYMPNISGEALGKNIGHHLMDKKSHVYLLVIPV